jgi:hypothetical protein
MNFDSVVSKPIPPYHIYLKMAYHLAQEARAGLSEFKLPPDLPARLFDYQVAAVKIPTPIRRFSPSHPN